MKSPEHFKVNKYLRRVQKGTPNYSFTLCFLSFIIPSGRHALMDAISIFQSQGKNAENKNVRAWGKNVQQSAFAFPQPLRFQAEIKF